jgi:hypothetical protein
VLHVLPFRDILTYACVTFQLVQAIRTTLDQWSDSQLSSTYAEAKRESHDFAQYKRTLKRQWVGQKADLAGMLSNICTKLKTYDMKPYIPPNGLALTVGWSAGLLLLHCLTYLCKPQDIDRCWGELLTGEANRSRAINANIREIKEGLRRKYADAANACERTLQSIALGLASLDGPLESQLSHIEDLTTRIGEIMAESLPVIAHLEQDCKDAGCEESDYTVYTTDDLEFEATLVKDAVAKKKAFVKNQVCSLIVTILNQELIFASCRLWRVLLPSSRHRN